MNWPQKAAASYRGQSVLVTGGLGFLGSQVVRLLAQAGVRVRVLDALFPRCGGSPRNIAAVRQHVELIIEDVRSRDAVAAASADVDVVFHLAGMGDTSSAEAELPAGIEIACVGTMNVLNAIRTGPGRAARVVIGSSCAVYGKGRADRVSESDGTDPVRAFGVQRLVAETIGRMHSHSHGVSVTSARISRLYGAEERVDGALYGSVAHALDSALHGEDVMVIGDGDGRADYLHVEDAAGALLALGHATVPDPPYVNVGSGEAISIREMAELVVEAVGGAIRVLSVPGDRRAEATALDPVPDIALLTRLSGLPRARSLRSGIRDSVPGPAA